MRRSVCSATNGCWLGGRGTWRIGRDDLEASIQRTYDETARWIDEHPLTDDDDQNEDE